MILLPNYSPASVEKGWCRIDRKFHVGTCHYVDNLDVPIVALVPRLREKNVLMDPIELPIAELPYRVETVWCDDSYRVDRAEHDRIEALVKECSLVYGHGFGTPRFARIFGKPYIPIVEYNLATQIQMARMPARGALRRGVRTVKTVARFAREAVDLRGAAEVHCNGYPVYEESRLLHDDRLLYLDSRMARDTVISEEALEARLERLQSGATPRLIFSGRFESIKGAMDVVETGGLLGRKGFEFELDLYGQGSEAEAMRARVKREGVENRIRIHEPIPYPELVERSHESDLFICCHVQDDPSCTYLEASGSGLVIAGYGNRMWRSFQRAAGNGLVTPLRRPEPLADAVIALFADPRGFADCAWRSRAFALDHCFENEYSRRVRAVRKVLLRGGRRSSTDTGFGIRSRGDSQDP